MPIKTTERYIQLLIIFVIVIVINVIAAYVYAEFDLTEDDRFTLSQNSKDIIASLDDNITIKVLLEGEFPAGFKRLQSSVIDLLNKFKDYNSRIVFEFVDPTEGSLADKERIKKQLLEDKIIPINLSYSDGKQLVQKPVFPFAIINYRGKKYVINLLEEQKSGDDEEVILNKSVSLLEYKFAHTFQRMQHARTKNILILEGQGEADKASLFRLESELRKFYKIGRVNLDSLMRLDSTIDLVILAGPKKPMNLQNQFKLDQYVMMGGKIIWLIDKFSISLDSISKYKFYVPQDIDTGLDDMLFKYGVRVLPDLVVDLECSNISLVVGMAGDKPQTQQFPWMYNPAIASISTHAIVKNIDRVNLLYPSTIDTLKTDGNVTKTILLSSSKYSRSQLAPVRLTFEILKMAPDPTKFNDGNRPVAVLLEGSFESFFKNRLTPEFKSVLDQLQLQFIEKSRPTKQIVISDSEFATNRVKASTGETEDIGFNLWERSYYKGSKDFILNSIEYMLDENGILASRSKEIKLRLLDTVKTKKEKLWWQFFNVGLPVLILAIFGLMYHWYRRRKYAY